MHIQWVVYRTINMPTSLPSLFEDLAQWEVDACARSVYGSRGSDAPLYVIDIVDEMRRLGHESAADTWRRIGVALGKHFYKR